MWRGFAYNLIHDKLAIDILFILWKSIQETITKFHWIFDFYFYMPPLSKFLIQVYYLNKIKVNIALNIGKEMKWTLFNYCILWYIKPPVTVGHLTYWAILLVGRLFETPFSHITKPSMITFIQIGTFGYLSYLWRTQMTPFWY